MTRRKRTKCISCGGPLLSGQHYVCTGCAFLALFGTRKYPQVQEVIWRRILTALEAEEESGAHCGAVAECQEGRKCQCGC